MSFKPSLQTRVDWDIDRITTKQQRLYVGRLYEPRLQWFDCFSVHLHSLEKCYSMVLHVHGATSQVSFFFFFPGLMFRGLGNGQCWLKAVAGLSDAACRSGSAFKCKRMHVEFFLFFIVFYFFLPLLSAISNAAFKLGCVASNGTRCLLLTL